jgi:hypothetical protein
MPVDEAPIARLHRSGDPMPVGAPATKMPRELYWWPGAGSNRRPTAFQMALGRFWTSVEMQNPRNCWALNDGESLRTSGN